MNNVWTAESVQGRVSRVLEDKEEVHVRSKKASSCLYGCVSGVQWCSEKSPHCFHVPLSLNVDTFFCLNKHYSCNQKNPPITIVFFYS